MLGRKKDSQIEITISNKTLLRILGIIIGVALVAQFIVAVRHPLTLVFVSFFLALALNPVVSWLSKKLKSRSRVGATALAYGIVTSVLILFMVLIVPSLIGQTTKFIREVPKTLSSLEDQDGAVGEFVRRYDLEEQVNNFASDWSRNLGNVQGPVLTTANRILSNVMSIVIVFVLTFMMLVEGPRWLKSFWQHIPKERRKHDQEIAYKMYKVVTSYVVGQVLVASIGAVFAMIAIVIASTILNVSVNAVALSGIVFLFALIPSIGAIIGAIFVALFSLFVSPMLALVMIVYFIIYQQIENATIQPYIQSRGIELTPMLVFIAAILGVGLGGVLGGFVAIPLAGCVKVLFDDWTDRNGIAAD